jgi:hypothetical protein
VARDLPAPRAAPEVQVDLPEMRGGIARLDAGHAAKRAARHVRAFGARVVRPRKNPVTVPGDERVDTGHTRQSARRVLHAGTVGACVNARMGEGDDDIGPARTQFRHPLAGGLDHVAGGDTAREMGVVPDRHLRRGKAHQADADLVTAAVGGAQVAGQDRDGWQERQILER